MAWSTLTERLNRLPLLLAGPILRKTTPRSVTVWVALQGPGPVVLEVFEGANTPSNVVATGRGETVKVGLSLHIAAVTARAVDADLKPGKLYFYQLKFAGGMTLLEASTPPGAVAQHNRFNYLPYIYPSFALPPADLGLLRIVHGSCRKPHGEGQDALSLLNAIIADSATEPNRRPHQLFLTGDQIYADDVAEALLVALADAAQTLVGPETMPIEPVQWAPGARADPLDKAGFTSGAKTSHLLSFGEYVAMYLFVWSDVLWPESLPTFRQVFRDEAKRLEQFGLDVDAVRAIEHASPLARALVEHPLTFRRATDALANLRSQLPDVRRALANVPTYMIFDDHEVTDDWYMTRGFCERVLGSDLGRRVIQNALAAYVLCQGWGNTPEQFAEAAEGAAGRKFLRLIGSGQPSAAGSADAAALLSVKTHQQLLDRQGEFGTYGLDHDVGRKVTVDGVEVSDSAIDYHYSVEGPSHQVIVTDTRTFRWFPWPGKVTAPDLIRDLAFERQIGSAPPPPRDGVLLVVVTTNAPPTPGIRAVELVTFSDADRYERDLFDSWQVGSIGFERLLAHLAKHVARSGSGMNGRVVLMSGDVHHGFASRLHLIAERLHEFDGSANVVFAQLVASGFKNEDRKTRGLHIFGHGYAPWAILRTLMRRVQAEPLLGWRVEGQPLQVGTRNVRPRRDTLPGETTPVKVSIARPVCSWIPFGAVTVLAGAGRFNLTRDPDWIYRLDYVDAQRGGREPREPKSLPAEPVGGDRRGHLERSAAVHSRVSSLRDQRAGRSMVGMNNIGQLHFDWGEKKSVRQVLSWRDPLFQDVCWWETTISLEPEDSNYPPLRPWRAGR